MISFNHILGNSLNFGFALYFFFEKKKNDFFFVIRLQSSHNPFRFSLVTYNVQHDNSDVEVCKLRNLILNSTLLSNPSSPISIKCKKKIVLQIKFKHFSACKIIREIKGNMNYVYCLSSKCYLVGVCKWG